MGRGERRRAVRRSRSGVAEPPRARGDRRATAAPSRGVAERGSAAGTAQLGGERHPRRRRYGGSGVAGIDRRVVTGPERTRSRVRALGVLVTRGNPSRERDPLHGRCGLHAQRDAIRHATAATVGPPPATESGVEDAATGVSARANPVQREVIVASGAALPIERQRLADAARAPARDDSPAPHQQLTGALTANVPGGGDTRHHHERTDHPGIHRPVDPRGLHDQRERTGRSARAEREHGARQRRRGAERQGQRRSFTADHWSAL